MRFGMRERIVRFTNSLRKTKMTQNHYQRKCGVGGGELGGNIVNTSLR